MNKTKLKIGIDFTYVVEDSINGIRMYGEEVLGGLQDKFINYDVVLFVNKSLEKFFNINFPQYKTVCVNLLFQNIRYIKRLFLIYKIKKEKCDIILHPYVSINFFAPIFKEKKEIITIHDIIHLDLIKDKSSKEYFEMKRKYIKLMNKSKNIITISEYSKKRLLEVNPNYNGNVVVIPNVVSKLKENQKDVKKILGMDAKYILTINSFYNHKNQITLVKAFNEIKNQIPHNLILIGRPELNSPMSSYNEILKYIDDNNLNDRIIVKSYISEEDRNALFYNTDLFISTSLQEGFGRTPVEAAMCNVPVISTMETSLPEATMGLVYYYNNATDVDELSKKILEVLNNKPSKEKLEKIASKLEYEYSKKKIAEQYIMLIEKILKE